MQLCADETFEDIADHVETVTGEWPDLYLNRGKVKESDTIGYRCCVRFELDALEPRDKEATKCLLDMEKVKEDIKENLKMYFDIVQQIKNDMTEAPEVH